MNDTPPKKEEKKEKKEKRKKGTASERAKLLVVRQTCRKCYKDMAVWRTELGESG